LTKYLLTNSTSKKGINHIKKVVKASDCEFHIIHQENDIGLDAIIELFSNNKPTGKLIAIQVKAGSSYVDIKKQVCKFNISSHKDYWLKHNLDVYGIVYSPELLQAYYLDIKKSLLQYPEKTVIKIDMSLENEFTFESFNHKIKGLKLNKTSLLEKFDNFCLAQENKSFRFFFNNLNVSTKNALEKILSVDNFAELLVVINCNLVSEELKNHIKSDIGMQQCSNKYHGNFYFSTKKDVFFEQKATEYFNQKFTELKTLLLND
jgi:hypothetical protein